MNHDTFQSPAPIAGFSNGNNVGQIMVIGQKKLQNQLLASCLEQETGMRCFIGAGFFDIPQAYREDGNGTNLLILDYVEAQSDYDLDTVKQMFPDCIICLYNAKKEGIKLGKMLGTVRGLFYENDSLKHLIKGIKAVIAGHFWLPRKLMEHHILHPPDEEPKQAEPRLTPKENEILRIIAKGASNQEVSELLGIKRRTVQSHLYYIYKKLGVSNRIKAALWANRNLTT